MVATGSTTRSSASFSDKHSEPQQLQKRKRSRRDAEASLPPRPGRPLALPTGRSPFPDPISFNPIPLPIHGFHSPVPLPVSTEGCGKLANEEMSAREFSILNRSSASSYTAVATPARRKRGPSLNRRTGQAGTVFQHCKTWDSAAPTYGKFWVDVPGSPERKRRTIPLGVCRTKSIARQHLRDYLQREAIDSTEAFRQNTAPAITFRQQAECWIASRSKTPSGQTRYRFWVARCTQRVAPAESRR